MNEPKLNEQVLVLCSGRTGDKDFIEHQPIYWIKKDTGVSRCPLCWNRESYHNTRKVVLELLEQIKEEL